MQTTSLCMYFASIADMNQVHVLLDLVNCLKSVTIYCYVYKELSPTSDTNLVRALMNLFDCLTDEFREEARISNMEDREIVSWIEVKIL